MGLNFFCDFVVDEHKLDFYVPNCATDLTPIAGKNFSSVMLLNFIKVMLNTVGLIFDYLLLISFLIQLFL